MKHWPAGAWEKSWEWIWSGEPASGWTGVKTNWIHPLICLLNCNFVGWRRRCETSLWVPAAAYRVKLKIPHPAEYSLIPVSWYQCDRLLETSCGYKSNSSHLLRYYGLQRVIFWLVFEDVSNYYPWVDDHQQSKRRVFGCGCCLGCSLMDRATAPPGSCESDRAGIMENLSPKPKEVPP